MAIIHQATIKPTKAELLEQVLGGAAEILGSYRFDDPDGEVGVEAFLVSRDGATRHVVFTYRGAPLAGADDHLVSTMAHSTLGSRWVYAGQGDPVALDCFSRALRGEQEQAVPEIWADGHRVEVREPTVALTLVPGAVMAGGGEVNIVTDIEDAVAGDGPRLQARWAGGAAVVAALS